MFIGGLFIVGAMPSRSWPAENGAASPTQKSHLTTEQQDHVAKLLAAFRQAKDRPADRERIVHELIEFGYPAVKQLSNVVNAELRGTLKRYGQQVDQRLAKVSRSKAKEVSPAEIQALRSTVLNLRDRQDLTEEMIRKEGAPAMARLRTLLLPDRKQVLDGVPEIQAAREKVLAEGHYWDLCAQSLAKLTPAPAGGQSDENRPASFQAYLHGVEDQAVDALLPISASDSVVLAANAQIGGQLDHEESRTILACNLTRVLVGLNALSIDPRLCEAARDHSHDMEQLKFFAHESPVAEKKTPWDRAKRMGTVASAENIFAGAMDGSAANEAWFHSPGHHKNMMGNHARIGVGRSGAYFTEMFGD